jgi:ssDNA-binding Zn-finger/Zn-ribbon topoisomerase 1
MDKSKVMPRCPDCNGPLSHTESEKKRGVGRCQNPSCKLYNKEQPVSRP